MIVVNVYTTYILCFPHTKTTKSQCLNNLARDYYHRDNKWCCCYEIKCIVTQWNGMEWNGIGYKTKITTPNSKTIDKIHSCEW